jgi:hypothetical protein
MCGSPLAAKSAAEPAAETGGPSLKWEPVTSEGQTLSPVVLQEIETRREPEKAEPVVEASAAKPEHRNDKWWVDERETTVGGPSFLGLSSAQSAGGGGYSYLFQDEPERSHKGLWVLLLVLVALGGVLYAKWQPVRDYVLTTAILHSRPKPKAARETANSTEPGSQLGTAQAAPTTTLASSDAQPPPAITTETKPAGNAPAANAKQGLPEGDKDAAARAGKDGEDSARPEPKASSADTKGGDAEPKKPGAKSSAASKDVTSANDASEEDASAVDEEKPSAAAAKKSRAAPAIEGGELVSSGEKYLYGRGVARSCDQAVSYFHAAAAKQNPQAYSHLGALYATGECVPMDRAAAYAWFRRAYAKEPSNHYFEQNLTMLWREMTPTERQRATGRQ